MKRRKFSWTDRQLDKLNRVIEILKELKEYKPLTLRQIYYQLVGKGYIENKVSEYTMLSNLLKWARIDGYVAWDDVEDRVRAFHDLTGWDSSDSFVKVSLDRFLKGYQRDLFQTQKNYIEVWIEKDALSSIFTRVASNYTVPVVVCRGFSSVSFLNEFKERLRYKMDKNPIMLYFGDFDPSGCEMLNSMDITLKDELGVDNLMLKRIGLLKKDIFTYKLPHNPNALKKTDTRAKKHLELYGELAVELDALRPDDLEKKIKNAIEDELDIEAFKEQIEMHHAEIKELDRFRTEVISFADKWKG